MTARDYQETLAWLYRLEAARGMDLKLERVTAALRKLGDPQSRFRSIHVAGTNGKGSVAAMSHAILSQTGLDVGLYTSPHLVDYRERIRVGDALIGERDVVELISWIRDRVDPEEHGLTFFEMSTILAFVYFRRLEVDVAVIEVGLGGRLDATNVIDADVAVITSIGLDHERFLGSTHAEIAREKAGIVRSGRPVVVGQLSEEALAVVEQVAGGKKAPIVRTGNDFHIDTSEPGTYESEQRHLKDLEVGLVGRHQRANAAVAIAAVDCLMQASPIADDEVRRGLGSVCWPGRLEVVREKPRVIFDAAHNLDSVDALVRELPSMAQGCPVDLLFGVLRDKPWRQMARVLAPFVETVTCTAVPTERGEDPEIVAQAFAEYCQVRAVEDPGDALMGWLRSGEDRVLLVAGSVFLLGALYPIIR